MVKPRNNYAFIDSQNLNLSIAEQGWKLDFSKFRKYLLRKYGIAQAFLFIGYIRENEASRKHKKTRGIATTIKL